MSFLFTLFTTYFWLICVIITIVNGAVFKHKSKKYIEEKPELSEGYATLIRGFVFWGNVPWVVMGIGFTIGGVPSVWHYFRPQDGNPYVLAWFVSVFVVWILGTYWLFFRDGAELLVSHPGLLNVHSSNPLVIKLLWVLCLGSGVVGIVLMYTLNIPTPGMP